MYEPDTHATAAVTAATLIQYERLETCADRASRRQSFSPHRRYPWGHANYRTTCHSCIVHLQKRRGACAVTASKKR